MAYSLSAAAARFGELAARARQTHQPVTVSESGRPVVAIIDAEDLAELQDRAALAAHLTDKAAGRLGASLDDLDAALDKIDAIDAQPLP
jgi:prevent-host-death family protein